MSHKKIWEYESFQQYKEENKDTFEKHKASFQKLEIGNDCIVTFENPSCSEGAMKFVYVDGVLTVQGDYGNASFNWHNPKNHILAYGTFDSFGYILSKLEAVQREGIKEFEVDLFHKEFAEYIKNKKEEGCLNDDFDDEPPYAENQCHVVEYMNENYELFGGDLEAEDYELGMYVVEQPYLWWSGLQTALKQLEEQGVFNEK